ncbi:hypothetical protein MZD11_05950 [Escherichia coli]|nr:hypothetical protein [Escherichia coli]MCQ6050345.1 hypothetical protein [Escherichia coli]MCQ6070070.1 hypothetical protein [Escherichia coli]
MIYRELSRALAIL